MTESTFKFKQFSVKQNNDAMKIGTDAVILGAFCKPENDVKHILDIGTGTGIIALMMAQKTTAQIDAIDITKSASDLAAENFANSQWKNRLSAINVDLKIFNPQHKYDLIISNPPFFDSGMKAPILSRATARHTDNLTCNDIFKFAKMHLNNNGKCFVIYPANQETKIIEIAKDHKLFITDKLNIFPKENYDIKRIIIGVSINQSEIYESNLNIEKENRHDYTDEYISLTKEFYLKF